MNPQFPLRTILLVDDDSDIRSLYKAFLQHAGYRVLTSQNAARAEDIFLSRNDIDLLLSDIHMPDETGIDLALKLVAHRSTLPVILISGSDLAPENTELIVSRSWNFVQRPVSLPYLLDVIHTALTPANVPASHRPEFLISA